MKKLIAVVSISALAAPSALAATSSIKVSPSSVKGGKRVTVSGTSSCAGNLTVSSKAFVGSVSAKLTNGKFSVKVQTKKKKGSYTVSARCGSKTIGSAKLKVKKSGGGGPPGGGFYWTEPSEPGE